MRTARYVALTGGMGSGKSSVAGWLAQNGARVFDADAVVHEILKTPKAIRRARELWGDGCLRDGADEDITLDTKKLARIIFGDAQARRDWESFIHPQIGLYLDRWLEEIRPEEIRPEIEPGPESGPESGSGALIIYDVPLFFETRWGEGRRVDEIWVVYAPHDVCVERLRRLRGMNPDDIERRLAAQMPLEEKTGQADVVIDNSGSWEVTVKQLSQLCRLKLSIVNCQLPIANCQLPRGVI